LGQPDSNKNKGYSERVEAQARSWVVYLHSGDATADKLSEFETWLGAAPDHAMAYHDYEQIMMDLGMPCGALDVHNTGLPEIAPPPEPARKSSWPPMRAVAGGVLAAALALTATIGLSLHDRSGTDAGLKMAQQPAIETRLAEIRDVTLPDGTVVTLGAKSRIDYKFEDGLRTVVLAEGEAYFDVAPDKAHPFYVQAGDRLVRVVGTEFDVRQSASSVVVSVVEGVVEVIKAQDPGTTEKLKTTLEKDVLTAGDKVVAMIGTRSPAGAPAGWPMMTSASTTSLRTCIAMTTGSSFSRMLGCAKCTSPQRSVPNMSISSSTLWRHHIHCR